MTFAARLDACVDASGSLLCCGLDPDGFTSAAAAEHRVLELVDETIAHVCAFKPNLAFFEQLGSAGYAILERLRAHIPQDRILILDAKRGDMGNTAEAYARALVRCPRRRLRDREPAPRERFRAAVPAAAGLRRAPGREEQQPRRCRSARRAPRSGHAGQCADRRARAQLGPRWERRFRRRRDATRGSGRDPCSGAGRTVAAPGSRGPGWRARGVGQRRSRRAWPWRDPPGQPWPRRGTRGRRRCSRKLRERIEEVRAAVAHV